MSQTPGPGFSRHKRRRIGSPAQGLSLPRWVCEHAAGHGAGHEAPSKPRATVFVSAPGVRHHRQRRHCGGGSWGSASPHGAGRGQRLGLCPAAAGQPAARPGAGVAAGHAGRCRGRLRPCLRPAPGCGGRRGRAEGLAPGAAGGGEPLDQGGARSARSPRARGTARFSSPRPWAGRSGAGPASPTGRREAGGSGRGQPR